MTSNDADSKKTYHFLDYTGLIRSVLLDLNHRDSSYWITPSTMKVINNGTDPLYEAMRNELPDALRTGRVSYSPVDFTEFSRRPDM